MGKRIECERAVSQGRQEALGVSGWPVWSKEISRFSWHYDVPETCYLIEGEVTVTPAGGEPVTLQAGDVATFPAGMSCEWNITAALRKHYRFG